jgi:hypothetical protein
MSKLPRVENRIDLLLSSLDLLGRFSEMRAHAVLYLPRLQIKHSQFLASGLCYTDRHVTCIIRLSELQGEAAIVLHRGLLYQSELLLDPHG